MPPTGVAQLSVRGMIADLVTAMTTPGRRTAAVLAALAGAALVSSWCVGGAGVRSGTSPGKASADRAAACLAEAWHHLEMVNYARAGELFGTALAGPCSRVQPAEGMLGLGQLKQFRQPEADIAEAGRLYEAVARDFAETPAAPLAVMNLARLADAPAVEKDRDRQKARRLYRQVMERYPSHFVADEAALRLGQTYLENVGDRAAEDEGAKVLQDWLAARGDNFLAAAMHLQLAALYERRGQYRRAVEHWTAADAADADAPVGRAIGRAALASLYLQVARVLEMRLKDYAEAARWYERIVVEIERDPKYHVAKLAADRCRRLASVPAGGEPDPNAPAEARP